jgi:amino acid adenylation domain-containing protein/thioester reductase-like protein
MGIMYKIRLSPYAEVFYNEWLLDPESSRYNILSADQLLYGNLNVKRLKDILKRYVAEHVLLNSHIQEINGNLYWVKNSSIKVLECIISPQNTHKLLSYVSNSFNLTDGEPLYRFKLLKIREKVYRFIVVFHHLVVDGISLNKGLFEEISNYYNDDNHVAAHSVEEQIELLTNFTNNLSTKIEQNKILYNDFWRKRLADIPSIDLRFLKFARDKKQNTSIEKACNHIKEIRFCHEEKITVKVNQIKLKYGITPYGYSHCIFAVLLNKYTGQEKLAVCYPIAIKEGLDFIYGAQVNLNLMPYHFDENTTIVDLFNQHQEFLKLTVKEEPKYGYCPITEIIQNVESKKVLDVYFAQAYFRDKCFKFNGITKTKALFEFGIDGITKDMLLFEQEPASDTLNYRVKYDRNTINEELLGNLITNYKKLFSEILEDILCGDSKKQLSTYCLSGQIGKPIQIQQNYPQNKTIHELFEEQVRKTPNNIAIIYANTKVTYQELNRKANQLANYLHRNYHIQPDDLVVLCLDKNEHLLIAILAVLKAGGAYVPVAPSYPDSRIRYFLDDTKPKVVLTNKKHQQKLQIKDTDVLTIDTNKMQEILSTENLCNLSIPVSSENLIYVIYTSGTTGCPKGVQQQHNNVMRLFTATNSWYHFTNTDIWTLFHSYAFDFTIWEIWGALLYGGKLVIPTLEQIRDIHSFYELCYNEKVTVLNQTPQAFYKFIDIASERYNNSKLTSLRYVIFGGETLSFSYLKPWFNLYGYDKPRLINMYGITETTVHVTYKEVTKNAIGQHSLIGKSIPDQQLYVLNNNLMPMPVGAIGELYVGGAGLARGYLNDSDLTKAKFISNPFQTLEEKSQNKNSKLYKTGDLVRLLPDGDMEYIGRNDLQIKIRGFRIESGEIESKLIGYNGIKQAVVIAKDSTKQIGDRYLVAYYVADKKLNELNIQNYLATQLPGYMLPTALVHLNQLPLTINGKLDKKALPEPSFENNDKYVKPRNEREELVCIAFAQVLGLTKVGVNYDFFRIGGNSLKAITLTTALQKNFDIKVADIFNLRTPAKLAESLHFGKDMLHKKLEQIKLSYQEKKNKKYIITSKHLKNKIDGYLKNINNIKIDSSLRKPIFNVLLTGATGFLGCNILYQLLQTTNYNVFVLVRASCISEAVQRLNKKFQFYFDKTLDDYFNARLFIFKADIEKNNLGLSSKEYEILVNKIDSIIHAAALVKHYGEYDRFYSANVHATINLLELSKLTKLKDFHYISTYSLLVYDTILKKDSCVYTEDDLPYNLGECNSIYDKTKLEGEKQVISYRNHGVVGSIYRIGNLAFIAKNYRVQEDIENNAFYNWLQCLFKIKFITKKISKIEISQVDLVANAITKLFDKKQLSNNIFHISNPNLLDLSSEAIVGKTLKVLSMDKFIESIKECLNNPAYSDLIVKFLLRQGWLDGWDLKSEESIQIFQSRTIFILKQLGFSWPPITSEIFTNYLMSLKLHGEKIMPDKPKILEYLEIIAPIIPVNVYWLDVNNIFLGANKSTLDSIGGVSIYSFIGKTLYDLYPQEMADKIAQNHRDVIRTGKILKHEEAIKDVTTGKIKYFSTGKAPLRNDNGEIIGIVGTSVDISADKKEAKRLGKAKVFEHLEKIAQSMPTAFYWLGLNQEYLGVNKHGLSVTGTRSYEEDFANKTPYDLYPKEMAKNIVQHHKEVIRTKKPLSVEETIEDVTTGKIRYFNAFIAPLYDDENRVIGTLGTSIETTAEKETERLKIENERQKFQLQQAKKIREITAQVSHDINSPLTSLKMLISHLNNVDEKPRVIIRNATNRIDDIANNLVIKYGKTGEIESAKSNTAIAPEIISCLISNILSEKRAQYSDQNISFELHIADDAQGLFAKVNHELFKRVMSNIVNNAVEAISKAEREQGCINVAIAKQDDGVCIQIKDNGCGFPKEIHDKLGTEKVSTKTEAGHGIGLSTAIQHFKAWGGDYIIDSKHNVGVTFTIRLPIAAAPQWFQGHLDVPVGATIVILDDDQSIHDVWDTRFKDYIGKVTLKHFNNSEALLSQSDPLPTNAIYLIDYELLGSKDTGIEVIKKLRDLDSATFCSMFLVTSRYEDEKIKAACAELNIKLIPKNFAPYIPITITASATAANTANESPTIDITTQPDYIFIDDDVNLVNAWKMDAAFKGVNLAAFTSIREFEKAKHQYRKDVPIYIDYVLGADDGVKYSKQLAQEGFNNIYLASGYNKSFFTEPMPWLKAIVSKMPPQVTKL